MVNLVRCSSATVFKVFLIFAVLYLKKKVLLKEALPI